MNDGAPLAAALGYAARGWYVLPLHSILGSLDRRCSCGDGECRSPAKHPLTQNGRLDSTRDGTVIRDWWKRWPAANVGIDTGRSALVVLDVDPRHDGVASFELLREKLGASTFHTLTHLTGGGGSHYLFQATLSRVARIASRANALGAGCDVKSGGGYIVAPPSLHISGRQYVRTPFSPDEPAELPEQLAELLFAQRNGRASWGEPWHGLADDEPIKEGARNEVLWSHAVKWARDGLSAQALRAGLTGLNVTCKPPLPDGELECIWRSAIDYHRRYDAPLSVADIAERRGADTPAVPVDWQDAYPWPEPMRDEAFYGIAGEFVRIVTPHTEADKHALLANILSGVSAMIGANPYTVGVRRQPAKVNALVVGDTGDARKGTAFEDVERFLRMADSDTLDAILAPGITSGEGLIRFLRIPVHKDDDTGTETPRLKRAWGREGEYTRLSAVARRDGSTLSQCLRDAFDSTTLANLTKKDPDRVRGAHVAISADVTEADLILDTPDVKIANGVVNRFALICARRERLLPRGGTLTDADLAPAAKRLNAALRAARERQGVPLSEAALASWDLFYTAYETEKLPPLLRAATRRGSQYVLRIALIHALLDGAAEIGTVHLEAAIAFWEYAFASAQHVFAARLGDPKADALLKHLRDIYDTRLTGAEVDEFFGKHLHPDERRRIRDELVRRNLITIERQQTGERGRPTELWQAKPPGSVKRPEVRGKSGLNTDTGISPYFSADSVHPFQKPTSPVP
jgi:hypothetical protein